MDNLTECWDANLYNNLYNPSRVNVTGIAVGINCEIIIVEISWDGGLTWQELYRRLECAYDYGDGWTEGM